MGRQALVSHFKSAGHSRKLETTKSTNLKEILSRDNHSAETTEPTKDSSTDSTSFNAGASFHSSTFLNEFVLKQDVTDGKIYWCLHLINRHRSLNSTDSDLAVIRKIAKDSEIKKK